MFHFNSIKVQLEHSKFGQSWFLFQFQFHKGTIRTWNLDLNQNTPSFQFHKGTIRTGNLAAQWLDITYFNSIKVQLELQQNPY